MRLGLLFSFFLVPAVTANCLQPTSATPDWRVVANESRSPSLLTEFAAITPLAKRYTGLGVDHGKK